MAAVYSTQIVLISVCARFVVLQGVTLGPCVEDGGSLPVAEVQGGQANSFYCRGLQAQDTVQWTFIYDSPPSTGPEATLGTCPTLSESCQPGPLPSYIASRTSDTESLMTIDPTKPGRFIHQGTLQCKTSDSNTARCQIDLITSSQGTTCTVNFDPTSWRTIGRCDVTSSTSSARGRFKCRWYKTQGSNEEILDTTSYSASNKVCSLDQPMPASDGLYNFRVKITPGETSVTATGNQEIKTPSATTASGCGGADYVLENTTVTCTCRTGSLGLPQGRLQWVPSGGGAVVRLSGDGSLVLTTPLSRADHQTRQFQCDVLWRNNVIGTPVMFNVGYRPENVQMTFGVSNSQWWPEQSDVNITCRAEGRPAVSVRLSKDGGSELSSNNGTLTHVLRNVTCGDAGLYRCQANNQFGTADATKQLYILCKPRSLSTQLPSVQFNGTPATVKFEVTAYPKPTIFTLLEAACASSTPASLHYSVTCEQLSATSVYVFTCNLTVYNMTSLDSGRYTLRVSNDEGHQDFLVEIKLNGVDRQPADREINCSPYIGAVIALAVLQVLVIVAICVVVFWLWRRHWVLASTDQPGLIRGSKMERAEDLRVYENPDSDLVSTARLAHSAQTGNYDSLQLSDVGQKSPYAELAPPQTLRERGRDRGREFQ